MRKSAAGVSETFPLSITCLPTEYNVERLEFGSLVT